MAGKKRDTVIYRLKQKRKTVYIGTTDDPERRIEQHKKQGKRFSSMQIASKKMTEEGAMKKEEEMLKNFRSNHRGKNPTHNKDKDG